MAHFDNVKEFRDAWQEEAYPVSLREAGSVVVFQYKENTHPMLGVAFGDEDLDLPEGWGGSETVVICQGYGLEGTPEDWARMKKIAVENLRKLADAIEAEMNGKTPDEFLADFGIEHEDEEEEDTPDPLEYHRNTYGVPAYVGRKITYRGEEGIITGASGPHVAIECPNVAGPVHPTDEDLVYLGDTDA